MNKLVLSDGTGSLKIFSAHPRVAQKEKHRSFLSSSFLHVAMVDSFQVSAG
jgi:hypothetical protein